MGTSYRFLVIGNGLIGSAMARHLSGWSDGVAVIGPSEPSDHRHHDGVFSSHYDQGRLISRLQRDPVWARLVAWTLDELAMLEERSGLDIHGPVGRVHATRPTPAERRAVLSWLGRVGEERGVGWRYFPAGDQSWREGIPWLDFPADFDVLHEPAPAGYLNPRQLVSAQNEAAIQQGAVLIEQPVVGVEATGSGVAVHAADGTTYRAERVLVACGAFTNFNGLLPAPIPLRLKTESVVMGTVSAATAARLRAMPAVGYDIQAPDIQAPDIQAPDIQAPDIQAPDIQAPDLQAPDIQAAEIDDIYMAPPIGYPDGTFRIKLGCNTTNESWPRSFAEVQAWFRNGDSDTDLPAMERALRAMVPDVAFDAVTSHRCIVTYTPSGYPIVDRAPGDCTGRLFVAAGGNGTGAQASDALGHAAAGLLFDGRWPDGLPRAPFRATNQWGVGTKTRSKAHQRAAAR